MANITTRQTAGTGATVAGVPLTNTQLDNNFININTELVQKMPLSGGIIQNYGIVHNGLGSISGTVDINLQNGNYVSATVTGATTFTFSNPTTGSSACGFVLELTNGGSASVIWPTSIRWPKGVAPILTTSGVDILAFITDDGGANWRGVLSMADSKAV